MTLPSTFVWIRFLFAEILDAVLSPQTLEKGTFGVTGDCRSPWKEEADTDREKALFLQLQATHRLWRLHQKPANERVTVTGSAPSSMCQQKTQMKEFTQTGLTAYVAAS